MAQLSLSSEGLLMGESIPAFSYISMNISVNGAMRLNGRVAGWLYYWVSSSLESATTSLDEAIPGGVYRSMDLSLGEWIAGVGQDIPPRSCREMGLWLNACTAE